MARGVDEWEWPRPSWSGPDGASSEGSSTQHEPVDRPQQVIARHVPLEAELVEQRRMIGLALAHHGLGSRCQTTVNQRLSLRPSAKRVFQQNRPVAAVWS